MTRAWSWGFSWDFADESVDFCNDLGRGEKEEEPKIRPELCVWPPGFRGRAQGVGERENRASTDYRPWKEQMTKRWECVQFWKQQGDACRKRLLTRCAEWQSQNNGFYFHIFVACSEIQYGGLSRNFENSWDIDQGSLLMPVLATHPATTGYYATCFFTPCCMEREHPMIVGGFRGTLLL